MLFCVFFAQLHCRCIVSTTDLSYSNILLLTILIVTITIINHKDYD